MIQHGLTCTVHSWYNEIEEREKSSSINISSFRYSQSAAYLFIYFFIFLSIYLEIVCYSFDISGVLGLLMSNCVVLTASHSLDFDVSGVNAGWTTSKRGHSYSANVSTAHDDLPQKKTGPGPLLPNDPIGQGTEMYILHPCYYTISNIPDPGYFCLVSTNNIQLKALNGKATYTISTHKTPNKYMITICLLRTGIWVWDNEVNERRTASVTCRGNEGEIKCYTVCALSVLIIDFNAQMHPPAPSLGVGMKLSR